MWMWDDFRNSLDDEGVDMWNIDADTKKVKASSQPPNSCYGVWDVAAAKRCYDPDTGEVLKFKTYDDALLALKALGYNFWNPELSYERPKPDQAAYVCYTELPPKKVLTITEPG